MAGISFPRRGDIGHRRRLPVAAVVHIFHVKAVLVGARHEVGGCRDRLVGDDEHVLQTDGRSVPGDGAHRLDLVVMGRTELEGAGGIGHLRLIHLEIPSHDGEDQFLFVPFSVLVLVAPHEEHGLGRLPGLNVEQLRQVLDRLRLRRGDPLHDRRVGSDRFGSGELSDLSVGRVSAALTADDRVLTDIAQKHELMGHLSSHDPRVSGHSHDRYAAPPEDVEVGLVVGYVLPLQTLLCRIEGIRVLHGELAHSQQTRRGPGLIAPLGLEMVDHLRQLAIRLDLFACQVGGDLLMGCGQHHVATVAVLEAGQ